MVGPLLDTRLIDVNLPSGDGSESIIRLTTLLAGNPAVTSLAGLQEDVLEREKLCPTVLGHGVAFPHARTEHVSKIILAAGRSPDGITFHDGSLVHLIFLIGTPNNRVTEYLGLVGSLTRTLKNPRVRESLMQAETPAAFVAALS